MARRPRYREQESPRLSANQMAEYLVSLPVAQQRIIRNARWQPSILVARYRDARKALSRFLASPTRDQRILDEARSSFEDRMERDGASQWTRQNA